MTEAHNYRPLLPETVDFQEIRLKDLMRLTEEGYKYDERKPRQLVSPTGEVYDLKYVRRAGMFIRRNPQQLLDAKITH